MRLFALFTPVLILLWTSCQKEPLPSTPAPKPPCELTNLEASIVDDLSDSYAHVFNGADPTIADDALQPLVDYLGDSPLVGLGEATHGTAEFYALKDKLFRLLVTEKGFKAIVFEIPWGRALAVNDYVTGPGGSAEAVVDQIYYWTYDTEEVIDLVQWIHDYNQNLPDEDKIYFVGCDPQGDRFDIEKSKIYAFLNTVRPDSVTQLMQHYNQLPAVLDFDYEEADPTVHEANQIGTRWMYDYLEANRAEFIERTSPLRFEITLMAAHVIQHRDLMYQNGDFFEARDSLMAHYAEWWQRILSPTAKVAIWAHNAHVMDATVFGSGWMGTYLRARHPEDYKNVGFSFGTGSFNAFLSKADGSFLSGVRQQSIPELQCETANHLLSQVEGDQHYLIFEELSGNAKAYFHETQPFIQLGAGFNYDHVDRYTQSYPLSQLFDVLIHFDETKASVLH